MIEISITPDGLPMSSLYTSTAVEDPRATEASAAMKQLAGTIVSPFLAIARVSYTLAVGRVVLPYRRAKVSIKSQMGKEQALVKGEAYYDNVKLNWISLSAIGAGIVRVGGSRRTAINGETIVENSFDGVATIAAANFHPCLYDPTQLPISKQEKWRVFAGIVATPEIGLVTGVGFAPFRTLSINAGVAWLRVKTTKTDYAIGQTTLAVDPFRYGTARAVVLGAGYKFS